MVSVKADAQLIHKRPELGLHISAEAEAAANAFAFVDTAPDDADAHDAPMPPPPPMSFDQIKATEMIQRVSRIR